MLKLDEKNKEIVCMIPLTTTSGKIRIKERNMLNEYGIPVATRSTPFSQKHYVEWQIGYDLVVSKAEDAETSLAHIQFMGANGKRKSLYELSEIVWHFAKWGVISRSELESVRDAIFSDDENLLFDVNPDLQITRSHPIPKRVLGIDFEKTNVNYPLLIHKFGASEVVAEIMIGEKQRAVGVQPMLYACFPVTELASAKPLLGRIAEKKERAGFAFSRSNAKVLLGLLRIFGTLSRSHRADILNIITLCLGEESETAVTESGIGAVAVSGDRPSVKSP